MYSSLLTAITNRVLLLLSYIARKGLWEAVSSSLPRKQWSRLIVGMRPCANSLVSTVLRRCGLATARPRTQCLHHERKGQWQHWCSRHSQRVGRPGSHVIAGLRASPSASLVVSSISTSWASLLPSSLLPPSSLSSSCPGYPAVVARSVCDSFGRRAQNRPS